MNNDNIPAGLVNMGLEKGKDTFSFLMRAAIWAEKFIGDQYLNNLSRYMKVYRITPKTPYTSLNPWPVPNLKSRRRAPLNFKFFLMQDLNWIILGIRFLPNMEVKNLIMLT
ncbi:hypothetical protein ACFQDF_05365 [Ectobacillus funiculus]